MLKVSKKLPSIQRQVDALESAGFEVVLRHNTTLESKEHPAVGATLVRIFDQNGYGVGGGEAYCSTKDNFDRTTGTRIAFRRAVSDFYRVVGYEKAGKVFS